MKIQPMETPRLYLRPFKAEDARFAINIWNDPETGKYLPDEAMEDIDEAYLKEIEALPDDPDCCYLIAEQKENQERIGTCSFIPSQNGQAYDIAYCVHPAHWRAATLPKWPRGCSPMPSLKAQASSPPGSTGKTKAQIGLCASSASGPWGNSLIKREGPI